MATYISILRGINVSGKNPIKMNLLQDVYAGLGFINIKTYIQSGNVVFQTEETSLNTLEKMIMSAIIDRFLIEIPVFVFEYSKLKGILELNPFPKEFPEEIDKLHITFLLTEPDKKYLGKIENTSLLPDRFLVNEKTVFLYCPNGYGRTKLNNNFFENKLKVVATTRNLKTISELVRISGLIPL